MKKLCMLLLGALLVPASMEAQEWQLVWADEFDGDQLDTEKWSYMIGDGSDYGIPGWGNNELQYYKEENVTVTGGQLTITAKRENISGKQFTSGRIRTKDKGDWTYNRIEFRAKMPRGQGLWAAVWMLPTEEYYGGWAASGEIDILEYLGHEPAKVYGTLHYGGAWPNNKSSGSSYVTGGTSFADEFHDFAFEWEEGVIRWFVDGNQYLSKSSGWYSTSGPFPAPFNRDFHLLVNLAVGGNWPGAPDASTQFPQQLVLDYIRIYQRGPAGVGVGGDNGRSEPGLKQNYPNPFDVSTVITYDIDSKMNVSLELFDALGRRVRSLDQGLKLPGTYRVFLDGSALPAGLYFCRLQTDRTDMVRRMSRL